MAGPTFDDMQLVDPWTCTHEDVDYFQPPREEGYAGPCRLCGSAVFHFITRIGGEEAA